MLFQHSKFLFYLVMKWLLIPFQVLVSMSWFSTSHFHLLTGILALTRQWKNVLYMPQISHFNFKVRKHRPYTVSFAVPGSDKLSEDGENLDDVSIAPDDDRVSLIEEGSLHKVEFRPSPKKGAGRTRYGDAAADSGHAGISRVSSVGSGTHKPIHRQVRVVDKPLLYFYEYWFEKSLLKILLKLKFFFVFY